MVTDFIVSVCNIGDYFLYRLDKNENNAKSRCLATIETIFGQNKS
jgi:hypothetical protein